MWQQLPGPALGLSRQSGEHILQIREGPVPVEARRLDQTHDYRGPFAGSLRVGQRVGSGSCCRNAGNMPALQPEADSRHGWDRRTVTSLRSRKCPLLRVEDTIFSKLTDCVKMGSLGTSPKPPSCVPIFCLGGASSAPPLANRWSASRRKAHSGSRHSERIKRSSTRPTNDPFP